MIKFGLSGLLFAGILLFGCLQTGQAASAANASFDSKANGSLVGGFSMAIKSGDTVKVDYLGTAGGKVFDTSLEAEAKKAGLQLRPSYAPLQFVVGSGQMISGFDKAVLGMKVGEEKTVDLPPQEAYGLADPKAVVQVPRSMFDNDSSLQVGLQVVSPQGMPGIITAVDAQNVSIDFNHPLAGKTLTFKIILREIVK